MITSRHLNTSPGKVFVYVFGGAALRANKQPHNQPTTNNQANDQQPSSQATSNQSIMIQPGGMREAIKSARPLGPGVLNLPPAYPFLTGRVYPSFFSFPDWLRALRHSCLESHFIRSYPP